MKPDLHENIDYFKYLLRKEEVAGLDDEERWELQNFISEHGRQIFVEEQK